MKNLLIIGNVDSNFLSTLSEKFKVEVADPNKLNTANLTNDKLIKIKDYLDDLLSYFEEYSIIFTDSNKYADCFLKFGIIPSLHNYMKCKNIYFLPSSRSEFKNFFYNTSFSTLKIKEIGSKYRKNIILVDKESEDDIQVKNAINLKLDSDTFIFLTDKIEDNSFYLDGISKDSEFLQVYSKRIFYAMSRGINFTINQYLLSNFDYYKNKKFILTLLNEQDD